MKYLFVLLLSLGVASAYTLADQDEALANSDLSVINFASSAVSQLPAGLPDGSHPSFSFRSQDQADFVKKLQDALRRTVESLKRTLDQGQEKGNELILRAHKLAVLLKQLRADLGEKFHKTVESYTGKAKEFVAKLKALFQRKPAESPLTRSRRSVFDRVPEVDEDETVRKICDTVVRLSLPRFRDTVREQCERHARAVIRRLNERLHPGRHEHDEDRSTTPYPDDAEELDRAEQPESL